MGETESKHRTTLFPTDFDGWARLIQMAWPVVLAAILFMMDGRYVKKEEQKEELAKYEARVNTFISKVYRRMGDLRESVIRLEATLLNWNPKDGGLKLPRKRIYSDEDEESRMVEDEKVKVGLK